VIIEQFLPAFHSGDAIGNSAISLHRFFSKNGIESRIIALTIDEILREKATFFKDYTEQKQSIKILHFAVPSQLTDYFLSINGKKVMWYHNITPSHFFVDYSDDLVRFTNEGRVHLKRLSECFDLSITESHYNAEELKELKYNNVIKLPFMIDLEDYNTPCSLPYLNLIKDERKNIIFVGRITPNKKIEDLIRVLFIYKKYLSPLIRLVIAGNINTLPKYFDAVRNLASRFYLTSEDIMFTGHIPFEELLSVYKSADVFLSMSEHEGFCLPLIESCYFRVPVVAFEAGAVPETLGGAGIIFREKKYDVVAGLIEKVIYDEQVRENIKGLQSVRIKTFEDEIKSNKLLDLLRDL
jgi:glycosyltransferase involved in cell wall biosynthesis